MEQFGNFNRLYLIHHPDNEENIKSSAYSFHQTQHEYAYDDDDVRTDVFDDHIQWRIQRIHRR